MSKIGAPILGRRGADGDENHVIGAHRGFQIKGERKTARRSGAGYHVIQPRLEDRDLSPLQTLDLAGIHVHAGDAVSEICQAGAADQSDVPGADDRDGAHPLMISRRQSA